MVVSSAKLRDYLDWSDAEERSAGTVANAHWDWSEVSGYERNTSWLDARSPEAKPQQSPSPDERSPEAKAANKQAMRRSAFHRAAGARFTIGTASCPAVPARAHINR